MSMLTADTLIAASPRPRVTQRRVVLSEWTKFRSLRSTWFSLGATVVAVVVLGIVIAAIRGNDVAAHGGFARDEDWTRLSLGGVMLALLAVGVLGVLMITGEYATGMVRASLAAVPRRTPVLLAKAAVLAVTTFLIGTVASLAAFLGGQAALSSHGFGVSISHPGALRAVIGGGVFLCLVALLALGCGFAVRSTGGALATVFGLLLVLPLLAEALPAGLQHHVDKFLPFNAGSAVMATMPRSDELGPWAGIGVLALYAAVALGVGLIMLRRRDA